MQGTAEAKGAVILPMIHFSNKKQKDIIKTPIFINWCLINKKMFDFFFNSNSYFLFIDVKDLT